MTAPRDPMDDFDDVNLDDDPICTMGAEEQDWPAIEDVPEPVAMCAEDDFSQADGTREAA